MTLELLEATVGHERFSPKKHVFTYSVFYVVTPVTEPMPTPPRLFSFDAWNIFSTRLKDHGPKDGSPWRPWIEKECAAHGITLAPDDRVLLIAHPRLFCYAFNPIAHWLVFEKDAHLKAVLCEVHNTFGDDHNYFLSAGGRPITKDDVFSAKKHLYVSPFNTVAPGSYTFSFGVSPEHFSSTIDYFEDGVRILNAGMSGARTPLTPARILAAMIRYPLMTFMIIWRIHYQALTLYLKGMKPTLGTRHPHITGETTEGTIER